MALPTVGIVAPIPMKTVYVNDLAIGQASTWLQVNTLLAIKGRRFVDPPTRSEGPAGFYVYGKLIGTAEPDSREDTGAA